MTTGTRAAAPDVDERERSRRSPRGSRAPRLRWYVAVAVLPAVLAGLVGGWNHWGGDRTSDEQVVLNGPAATRLTGDVDRALTQVFSYRPGDLAATERAADAVLAGPAREQYRRLFAHVRAQAPAQRLTLTTKVVRTGVIELSGDRARLLVFLDQVSTRKGRPAADPAAAQLLVTARRADGRWRITDLHAA